MYTEQHLSRMPKPYFRLVAIAIYCLQAFTIRYSYRVAVKEFVKIYPDTFEFSYRIQLDDLPTKEWPCANNNSALFCPCSLQEIAILYGNSYNRKSCHTYRERLHNKLQGCVDQLFSYLYKIKLHVKVYNMLVCLRGYLYYDDFSPITLETRSLQCSVTNIK